MDVTAVSSTLGSIGSAIEMLKGIRQADLAIEKAEVKLRLAEVVGALADAKLGIADVQNLLEAKDAEIRRLQDALRMKEKLVRQGEAYFEANADGTLSGAPYCSYCWEVDQVAVHIFGHPVHGRLMSCARCKNTSRFAGVRPENSG